MNDVSARDVQLRTSQWTAGKALDTFAPMGPGIVLASALPDPQGLVLITRVNGQVVQHASTATMLFSVATIVSFLSSLMTLEPGDIIATGTPSGVGFKRTPPLFFTGWGCRGSRDRGYWPDSQSYRWYASISEKTRIQLEH